MSSIALSSAFESLLRRLPFVGYVMRLLETGANKELALFTANALAALVLLIATFGFPFFMLVMYAAVGLAASFILLATRG